MAKKNAAKSSSGKPKFDFQQFLLEKGEKIALSVAGIGLALLALLGILAATGAASPANIAKDLKDGAQRIEATLANAPGQTFPEPEMPDSGTFVKVDVTMYPTPNPWFNTATSINEKRVNPTVLALLEGRADFVQGGVPAYDIIGDKIAVKENRQVAANKSNQINLKGRRRGPTPPQAPPQPPPSTPPNLVAPPPGAAPPGMAPPGGGRGGRGGPGGIQAPMTRTNEGEIIYIDIEDKAVDTAELALNLLPLRAARIVGIVPYKKQVEKFMQALRLPTDQSLESEGSAPIYKGFEVERLELAADGKTVLQDWTPFDHIAATLELYRLAKEYESEDNKIQAFLPDGLHKLYLKRPKLARTAYGSMTMTELSKAIEELEKMDGQARNLTDGSKQKKLKTGDDPFDLQDLGSQTQPQQPGINTAPIVVPPPGGGPGRGSPRVVPPPGKDGVRGVAPPGVAAQPSVQRNSASPVWILQFMDPTIQPGLTYKYRIRLKMKNPNYQKKDLVVSPGQAAIEDLPPSEWYEIPEAIKIPADEYVFADPGKYKSPTSLGTQDFDTTMVKFHRWMDRARLDEGSAVQQPIAEWVIADLDVQRGQFVRKTKAFKLPFWSMLASNYVFRDRISLSGGRKKASEVNKMENVNVDFTPRGEIILVDFDGGKGPYRVSPAQTVVDEAASEILLLSADGESLKLVTRNSVSDGLIPEKEAREKSFKAWLEEIARGPDQAAPAPGNQGR